MKIKILITVTILYINWSYSQCWKSVSAGHHNMIAIANDNTLWGWGLNFGSYVPVQIGIDSDWKSISSSTGFNSFFMALKNNGTLWTRGANLYGQLGDGTFNYRYTLEQVGTDSDWKSISAGYSHALATKQDGTLWSWGDSDLLALGYVPVGPLNSDQTTPLQVGTLNTWDIVSAGDRYSLALKYDGTVYGWGYNGIINILGLSPNYTVLTPQIRSYNNSGVKSIAAGRAHNFDLKLSNGLLVTWGADNYGQRGNPNSDGIMPYIKEMDCGKDTSAIIKLDGTLWYTGERLGQINPIGDTVYFTNTFLQLGNSSNWHSISLGFGSGAAINTDGELWTWGFNDYGSLGNGTTIDSPILIQVACPSVLKVDSNKYNQKFSLYPNPVIDILEIKTNELSIDKLVIKDITGKTVMETNDIENKLDVSILSAGLYLLQIEQGDYFEVIKFVKK